MRLPKKSLLSLVAVLALTFTHGASADYNNGSLSIGYLCGDHITATVLLNNSILNVSGMPIEFVLNGFMQVIPTTNGMATAFLPADFRGNVIIGWADASWANYGLSNAPSFNQYLACAATPVPVYTTTPVPAAIPVQSLNSNISVPTNVQVNPSISQNPVINVNPNIIVKITAPNTGDGGLLPQN